MSLLIKMEVEEIYKKKVSKHSTTTGRIYLPERFIGKEVLIIVPKKEVRK